MNEDEYKRIGQIIRSFRKEERMTQADLAAQIGISTSFMGHIERGTRIASLSTMKELCRALNISMDMLMLEPESSETAENGPTPLIVKKGSAHDDMDALRFALPFLKEHEREAQEPATSLEDIGYMLNGNTVDLVNTGKQLFALRKQAGYNITELAKQLKIQSTYLSLMESGRYVATFEQYQKLSIFYGVPMTQIIFLRKLSVADSDGALRELLDHVAGIEKLCHSMLDLFDTNANRETQST